MQNKVKEVKRTDWRKAGRKILIRTLSGVLVVVIAANIANLSPEKMIKACGGIIHIDMQKMKQPPPVDYADTIHQGIYVKHGDIKSRRSIINWTADDAALERMNLQPDREIFNRTVRVKYRSVMIVQVNAGCTYRVSTSKPFQPLGMVLTRISINGRECAKDNAAFSGVVPGTLPLCSSAGCIKVLEPGEHELIAEGIFAGTVESNHTSVQVSILRYQEIDYKQYRDSKSSNHRWISRMSGQMEDGLSPSNKKSETRAQGVKDVKQVTS